MTRIVLCFLLIAFQACSSSSSRLSPQQIAAYSVATGFLTLCDDGDYKGALDIYGEPIKSHPEGTTWIAQMQGKRRPLGLPIVRYWTNRQRFDESPQTTFEFSAPFTNASSVEEIVSVTRISAKWQVYDYKFHAFGKHSTPAPASPPVPLVPAKSRIRPAR